MPTDVLEQPTLILNRNWQPIHVTTVVRALVMLWNDAARVVEPEEYRLYTWDEWARLEPPSGRPLHPLGACQAEGPRGRLPVQVRPAPLDCGHLQPAERRQARPPDLPVLRRPAGLGGDHDRPRPPSLSGGCVELDQLRGRLRRVQRPEGRPDPRAGRHAAQATHPPGPSGSRSTPRRAARVKSWARFLEDEPALALA